MDESDKSQGPPGSGNPVFVEVLLKIDRSIGFLEHVAVAVFLAMLVVVGSYTAIARNFLDSSPSWGDEVIRYSVFFIAMTGAALAAQTNQLIRMDVLTRALSPRGRAVARICTAAFTIAVCFVLAHAGQELRETALASEKSTAEFIEPVTAGLMIPVGALLIAFHVGVQMIELIAILARGETPPEETQSVH